MVARATATINGDTLALAGVLDFDSVLGLQAQGQQWLEGVAPDQCKLDLAAVTYSSSVGIALLLCWLRIARQQRKTLRVEHAPADMLALAQVGGLEDLLSGV